MATLTRGLKALKAKFDRAHADGMRAIADRDYDGFADAIRRENEVLQRQSRMIHALRAAVGLPAAVPGVRRRSRRDDGSGER